MLVDTSVWIDFFNGYDSREAMRLAEAIAEGDSISVPGIVLTEILLGLRDDAEAARIADLLGAFDEIAGPTRTDYAEAARIYRVCRLRGFTIRSTIDCLIAHLSLRDGIPLLTKDRDFKAIAQCLPLQLLEP